ncbi:hypothetical protein GJ496_008647 [Pomphorhynchus laevis]|nr:hypothetical protein GJ496_008647 [Pomphorhynchus laevis]
MEKTHDVSVDEPSIAHQAILFILDVLIRNEQEMDIETLYNTFGDPTFTPHMLRAIGGNEEGLKLFLYRYPSLFTIRNQIVRANSGADQLPSSSTGGSYSCSNSSMVRSLFKSSIASFGRSTGNLMQSDSNSSATFLSDSGQPLQQQQPLLLQQKWDTKTMKEIEQEAIAFFKKQMARKEEEWLPIVSVAGHASQASPDIRKFVGPQNEFLHFLLRYPDIFLVRDEYCGLKGKADKPNVRFPPPSPPPKRRSSDNTIVSRSTSFTKSNLANRNNYNACSSNVQASVGYASSSAVHLQLNPIEVKSVHYIMRLLHRCGKMLVQNVPNLLNCAPEPIVQTIGHTREELVHFFKLHAAIFQLHPDGCVSVKSDAVRALIHKDKSFTENSVFTNSGIVLRIFPKYGIVNMENNEQVFFDIQSCQFESFGDLTCILHPGDRLWFNAILGPKDGSTKWRSLKTWIKMKPQNVYGSNSNKTDMASSLSGFNNKIQLNSICSSNFENDSSSPSSSKHSVISPEDSQRCSPNSGAILSSSIHHISAINGLNGDCEDDNDLNQYQITTDTVESSDESSLFNVSGDQQQIRSDRVPTGGRSNNRLDMTLIPNSMRRHNNNNSNKEEYNVFASPNSNLDLLVADKITESVRSTSMMDLRSLACSLPVLASTNGRLGFIPINCPSTCIQADNIVPSCSVVPALHNRHNIQTNKKTSKTTIADDDFIDDTTIPNHKQDLNGCINLDTIRNQVHSTARANVNISERMIISENLISVSAQTISSGDILATNIFVD